MRLHIYAFVNMKKPRIHRRYAFTSATMRPAKAEPPSSLPPRKNVWRPGQGKTFFIG